MLHLLWVLVVVVALFGSVAMDGPVVAVGLVDIEQIRH
jgi:hypothetical protein